jgi:dTDP-4-amino-4,6-dideoxygalactose transaminase
MTDIQASLGLHQLAKLDSFIEQRRAIAERYAFALGNIPGLVLPAELPHNRHTWHVYPIRLIHFDRSLFIDALKEHNIGASVHFIPLHRHPFYRDRYGYQPEQFPMAEKLYEGMVSLPLYPKMTRDDERDVLNSVREILV